MEFVLYAQAVIRLANIKGNEKAVDRLYIAKEYFVISRHNNLIVVETSAIPQNPIFSTGYFDHMTFLKSSTTILKIPAHQADFVAVSSRVCRRLIIGPRFSGQFTAL